MDRLRRWGDHPAGPALLVLAAVLEATLFPAPTEAVLIALILARPERAVRLVGIAAAGSALGGALGYAAGAALYPQLVQPLLQRLGVEGGLGAVGALYRDNLAVALLTSGYTPIPYLVYTFAGGVFRVPLLPFLVFSLLGRGIKYAGLGLLARLLGPAVQQVAGRWGPWVVAAVTALLLLGWWLGS